MFVVEIWGIPSSVSQPQLKTLVASVKEAVAGISRLNKKAGQVRVRIPREQLTDNPDHVISVDVSRVYCGDTSSQLYEEIRKCLYKVVAAFAKAHAQSCRNIEVDMRPFETRLYGFTSYDMEGNLTDLTIKPIPEATG